MGAAPALLTQKLGQYELLERIAIGGMAEVYRGRAVGEGGFEKPVAVKRILPHLARDPRFITMLVTEARIHSSLSHRNIIQIHDLGVSQAGEYFIVLEYVDGRDLASVLEATCTAARRAGQPARMDDALALYIAIEIAEGMHFAHELRGPDGQALGLVHRDVSPNNVLLSYAGEVKLLDFGLAKRNTDHSVVRSLKGKLTYMAPEQAQRGPLDRRSDIFSLGAVLFEMVTGHRPRTVTDEIAGWREVAAGIPPQAGRFRPDLPPVLAELLKKTLAKSPQDRFPDALAFAHAARQALDLVPRSPAGENADLQSLMRQVLPPGSPRSQSQPAQVIRLVSEFYPLPEIPPPLPLPAPPTTATKLDTPKITATPARRNIRPPSLTILLALLLFAISVTAAAVHVAVAPLPLLRLWMMPAHLEILSQPEGAEITLDGRRLPLPTPASADIRRDRHVHVIELRKEGFHSASGRIRYDRTEKLSISLSLAPESRPAFEPLPSSEPSKGSAPPARWLRPANLGSAGAISP